MKESVGIRTHIHDDLFEDAHKFLKLLVRVFPSTAARLERPHVRVDLFYIEFHGSVQ